MDDGKHGESDVSPPTELDRKFSSAFPLQNSTISPSILSDVPDDLAEEGDDMAVSNISDEDAQSLLEPSISQAAMRLKSPKTPALEKAAAMGELEGGGFFDADPEIPSPPDQVVDEVVEASKEDTIAHSFRHEESPVSPKSEDLDLPITTHHADPNPLPTPRSTLRGVFDSGRKRSLSGGTDALLKLLPKGLPSMAQVGNLFGSGATPKSRFGSSSSLPKDSGRTPLTRPYATPQASRSPVMRGSYPSGNYSTQQQVAKSIVITPLQESSQQGSLVRTPRPKAIRRVTSDSSLLYHSLSRTSSLGDDTRFEKQHDQVNSRVKAIRDSFQDRSSFKMPQMPSMPSLPRVSSFSFNMNFLNATNSPSKWSSDTDAVSDTVEGSMATKKPSVTPSPPVARETLGAAASRLDVSSELVDPLPPGSNTGFLDRAMESLTGDIVIMGGYRGSILRSAKPPHRQLWVPVKVGLNIRKVDLEVGLDPEDEERMSESIFASGMLQNIGLVDISKRLFKRLRDCENARNGKLRVWDYGYDWRLSPHLLSRRLASFLERLPSNQLDENASAVGNRGALVIAHSLGGLITRHVVNQRPELFSGVIYAGVPQSCVNILGPLRNGDAVLLSSRVLTAQVNFTLRTSFVLLPEDGRCFLDINTKERYPVDFFNVEDWIKYRWSPCTDPPLPPRLQPSSGLGGLLNMSASRLSLPGPVKKSIPDSRQTSGVFSNADVDNTQPNTPGSPSKAIRASDVVRQADHIADRTIAPQMNGMTNPVNRGQITSGSVSTAVTIPRERAIAYLRRTLAETKKFKGELHFRPELSESNLYPPLAVIYGKSIPTLFGAKVDGSEGIACADSYDNLAFASGDGVCLAREAMLPEGYKTVYGGRISSDRGHVSLLGDLNAIGRLIEAITKGRAKGIGLGRGGGA